MNRIALTVHRLVTAAFLVGALVFAAPALAQAPPTTIRPGVTIEGIDVGGITSDEATAAVRDSVQTPFALRFRGRNLSATAWQVGARSAGDLSIQRAQDLFYILNRSIWLDLYILLETPIAVMTRRGAK